MRVRLLTGSLPASPAEQFPALGTLLHPESNRQEWAVVLLDRTLSTTNSSFEMLFLRPRFSGEAIGEPKPVHVHVAPVIARLEMQGKPGYFVGERFGDAVCEPES